MDVVSDWNGAAVSSIPDKSLDLVVSDGDNDEAARPLLRGVLARWTPKLVANGVFVGTGYRGDRPLRREDRSDEAEVRRRFAIRRAVDEFRVSDENGLGQDSSVTVAGGSLFYFRRLRPKIFGVG